MDLFDPAEAVRLIEAGRMTIFSGVPTMCITILGHPDFGRHDLRSLRAGSIGAAPVPAEIMRKILDPERGKVQKFRQEAYAIERYELKSPA